MSTRVEHANGGGDAKFIERIDPEDPEYRRELQRPADVKEDMRQMESRQRVSSILNSQAFREELESIIADQMKHGPHPSSLIALQQISELLLPNTNSRWQQVSNMGKSKYFFFISSLLLVVCVWHYIFSTLASYKKHAFLFL